MKRICVFCGSSSGARLQYVEAARALGNKLADQGIGLVYGGASIGLMGAVADTVLSRGGEVIGVIPQHLLRKEVAHHQLKDLRVVGSMHERKALMAELSDGFIALPGGFGTFEELCEVITWSQLGLHGKPTGILNVCRYYDPLLALMHGGVQEEFIRKEHGDLVLVEEDPSKLLERMRNYRPVKLTKWILNKEDT